MPPVDAPSCKTRREVSLVQLETRAEEEPPGAAPFLMMCCIARNGSYAAGHRDSNLRRCGRDRDRRWLWNWEGAVRGNQRARCRSGGGQDFCNSVRVKSQRLRNKDVPGAARKPGASSYGCNGFPIQRNREFSKPNRCLRIAALRDATSANPEERWRTLYRTEAPQSISDLLIRSLPTRA